jgi:hypothetical protein
MTDANSTNSPRPPGFWGSRYAVGLLVLGGIAAYLLLSEHRAHFLGALPLLLLLACPLMHVFMHHGHGGHHAGHHAEDGGADSPAAQSPRKNGARP